MQAPPPTQHDPALPCAAHGAWPLQDGVPRHHVDACVREHMMRADLSQDGLLDRSVGGPCVPAWQSRVHASRARMAEPCATRAASHGHGAVQGVLCAAVYRTRGAVPHTQTGRG